MARDRRGHRRHFKGEKAAVKNMGNFQGQPPKTIKREGITRQPYRKRVAKDLPLTERHLAILQMVDTDHEHPTKPTEIAEVLGLPATGVQSSLYALQDRGLVERVPFKGWVKKEAPARGGR